MKKIAIIVYITLFISVFSFQQSHASNTETISNIVNQLIGKWEGYAVRYPGDPDEKMSLTFNENGTVNLIYGDDDKEVLNFQVLSPSVMRWEETSADEDDYMEAYEIIYNLDDNTLSFGEWGCESFVLSNNGLEYNSGKIINQLMGTWEGYAVKYPGDPDEKMSLTFNENGTVNLIYGDDDKEVLNFKVLSPSVMRWEETGTDEDGDYDIRYIIIYNLDDNTLSFGKWGSESFVLENNSSLYCPIIENSEHNEKIEYYNINGQKIEKPEKGIVIRLQGCKVEKISLQ